VSEINFVCVPFFKDINIKQWFHKNIKLKIRKIGGTEAHFVQTFLWILTICSFDTLVLALWFISNAGWDLVVFPF
jgi:stage V sporulation protein SpoVS